MVDFSFQNNRTLADYMGANRDRQLQEQIALAKLQEAAQFDLKARGEQALYNAAAGLPYDQAAASAFGALRRVEKVNPQTGDPYFDRDPFAVLGIQPQAGPQYVGSAPVPQMRPNAMAPVAGFKDDLAGAPAQDPLGALGIGGMLPRTNGMSTKTKQAVEQEQALKQLEAERNLPKRTSQADDLIGQVKALSSHPGMAPVVGMPSWSTLASGMTPFRDKDPTTGVKMPYAGTDAADFNARLGQVKGAAFMEAYQTLKGGGQITEVEGIKATQALTRMNAAQSEAEFKAAADEFIYQTKKGVNLAAQAAGQPPVYELKGEGLSGKKPPAPNGGFKYLGKE